MDKKGFTLVELLAIVVVLAIIMVVAAPSMTKQVKKSEEETQNILNQKIENASKLYAAKYFASDLVNGKEITFTLNDLQQDGLINLKDNCNGKLSEEIIIKDGTYIYSNIYDENCYTALKSNENSIVKNTTKSTTTNPGAITTKNTTTKSITTKPSVITTTKRKVLIDGMAEYKEIKFNEKTVNGEPVKKKTATLKPWVIGYKTDKFIQGFAITKDYVYLSTVNTTGSIWTTEINEDKLKDVSSNRYYRIDRKTDEKESIINPYAGHAQSFDVASEFVNVNGKKEDQLFFNAFPNFSLKFGKTDKRGAGYQGFGYNRFESNTGKIIPGKVFALYRNPKKGKQPAFIIKRDSIKGKDIDERIDNYIKTVATKRNSNGDITSGNKDFMPIPEVAVDESNNKIVFSSGKKVYIFNLSKLKRNDEDAYISEFNSNRSGLQGLELYNNTLYMVQGSSMDITEDKPNFNFNVEVYNIKNTEKVTSKKYEFNIDYSTILSFTNNIYWKVEPEGISIYDGKIYLLLMRTEKSVNPDKFKNYYIDIITMDIK